MLNKSKSDTLNEEKVKKKKLFQVTQFVLGNDQLM